MTSCFLGEKLVFKISEVISLDIRYTNNWKEMFYKKRI